MCLSAFRLYSFSFRSRSLLPKNTITADIPNVTVTAIGVRLRRRRPPQRPQLDLNPRLFQLALDPVPLIRRPNSPPQLDLNPRLFLLALDPVPILRLLLQTKKKTNRAKTSFMFCGRYHNTFPVCLQTSPRYSPLNEGRSIISIPTRKNFQYMQCLIR
jgi:hypothetical protein